MSALPATADHGTSDQQQARSWRGPSVTSIPLWAASPEGRTAPADTPGDACWPALAPEPTSSVGLPPGRSRRGPR
jgi:hypothetical protein